MSVVWRQKELTDTSQAKEDVGLAVHSHVIARAVDPETEESVERGEEVVAMVVVMADVMVDVKAGQDQLEDPKRPKKSLMLRWRITSTATLPRTAPMVLLLNLQLQHRKVAILT